MIRTLSILKLEHEGALVGVKVLVEAVETAAIYHVLWGRPVLREHNLRPLPRGEADVCPVVQARISAAPVQGHAPSCAPSAFSVTDFAALAARCASTCLACMWHQSTRWTQERKWDKKCCERAQVETARTLQRALSQPPSTAQALAGEMALQKQPERCGGHRHSPEARLQGGMMVVQRATGTMHCFCAIVLSHLMPDAWVVMTCSTLAHH